MTRYRSHSAAFKRQVAEEFIAGETLRALPRRHDISWQLIRIWVGEFESGLRQVLSSSLSITPPRLLRKHTRSQGPSLHRHYPASTVLRPCQTSAQTDAFPHC
jgi:transposase-like protein